MPCRVLLSRAGSWAQPCLGASLQHEAGLWGLLLDGQGISDTPRCFFLQSCTKEVLLQGTSFSVTHIICKRVSCIFWWCSQGSLIQQLWSSAQLSHGRSGDVEGISCSNTCASDELFSESLTPRIQTTACRLLAATEALRQGQSQVLINQFTAFPSSAASGALRALCQTAGLVTASECHLEHF